MATHSPARSVASTVALGSGVAFTLAGLGGQVSRTCPATDDAALLASRAVTSWVSEPTRGR